MQSVGAVTFAKVNSCTYRVGTRNKRAAGWLMEVAWPGGSRQRWVARVGDRASEPLSLEEAKQAAIAFLRERGKVKPRDFIAELNQIAANEVDGARARRKSASVAGQHHGRRRRATRRRRQQGCAKQF